MMTKYAKALLAAYAKKIRDIINEVPETDYKMLVYPF